jgi:hypothetical protein
MADASDPDVQKTLVDAYYRRVVDAPEAARRRAQNGYAVTGATAAGVATVGAFSDLADQPVALQIVGPLALVAWLITAGLFMWAVAAPYEDQMANRTVSGPDQFQETVMANARAERDEIDGRQARARLAAIAAVVITVAAAVMTLALPAQDAFKDATLRFEPPASAALADLCERSVPRVLDGVLVDPGSLSDAAISVRFPAGKCRRDAVTISLQRSELAYLIAP